MAHLRLAAERLGVKSVDMVEDKLQIRFHDLPAIEPQRLVELVGLKGGSLTPSGILVLPAPPRGADRVRSVTAILREVDPAPLPRLE
jgi:hypothetical protein